MSFEDWEVVADAKSPFSTSATDTPRSASSRATPAPAIPPPTMTTSYSASSSGQGRPCTGSVAPTPRHGFDHSPAPSGARRAAPAITVLPGDDGRQLRWSRRGPFWGRRVSHEAGPGTRGTQARTRL